MTTGVVADGHRPSLSLTADGAWGFTTGSGFHVDRLTAWIECEGAGPARCTFALDDAPGAPVLTAACGPLRLVLAPELDDAGARCTAVLWNHGAEDVRVRTVTPLAYDGDWEARDSFLASSDVSMLHVPFERCYGHEGVLPIGNRPAESWWWTLLEDHAAATTLSLSIDGIPCAAVRWNVVPWQSHQPGRRVLRWRCDLDCLSGARGVRIPSHGRLELGSFRIARHDTTIRDAAASLFDRLSLRCDVRLPSTPPVGWCSWYACGPEVTSGIVHDAIAACAEHPSLDIIQIDDGWMDGEGTRGAGAPQVHTGRFPDGLPPVLHGIAAAGRTPGLWLRPFEGWTVHEHAPSWARGACLDLSDPDALEWLRARARSLTSGWGAAYLKLDFIGWDVYGCWGMELPFPAPARMRPTDDTRTNLSLLRAGLSALRTGAAEGTVVLGCNIPLGAAIGLLDAMRIGDDVDAANVDRTVRMGAAALAALHEANGRVWWNDLDVALFQPPMPVRDAAAWSVMVALSGGSFMIGSRIEQLDAQRRTVVAACLALHAKVSAGPVCVLLEPDDPELLLLLRPATADGDAILVCARRGAGRASVHIPAHVVGAANGTVTLPDIRPSSISVYRISVRGRETEFHDLLPELCALPGHPSIMDHSLPAGI